MKINDITKLTNIMDIIFVLVAEYILINKISF